MTKTRLSCGCEFELDSKGRPLMEYSLDKINLECQKTWDLISSGRCTGLFQLDSGLGQTMSKQLKPRNIDHLAALIAIMRPSALQGRLDDGKSIAQHFMDRKNNLEPSFCQFPVLEPILKDTFYLMIFQEQSIRIGQEIAGMSLEDSDHYIRSGIGKKKADVIAEAEKIFLDGCKRVGKVNDKEALEIWNWIKSSARYQFNLSHSVSYAFNTLLTAVSKSHFPLRFFKSYLNHSYDKPKPLEEIKNLVLDSKSFKIDVCNPDIRLKNNKFIEKGGRIYFGLQYIKGVGEAHVEALRRAVCTLDLDTTSSVSWTELLFRSLLSVNKGAIKPIIACGGLSWLKIDRKRLLHEHDICLKLNKRETDWIINNIDLSKNSVENIFKEILSQETGKNKAISTKTRKNIIKGLEYALINPGYNVNSTIYDIVNWEKSFLGVELSCSKLDTIEKDICDTYISEYEQGKNGRCKFIVEINKINVIKTKEKQEEMGFLTIIDTSGFLKDVVAFPKIYEKYKHVLFENNLVLLIGSKGERGNFIIQEVKQV